MYQILIVDKNESLSIPGSKGDHTLRVPGLQEHILVKWNGETKVCEVEDVWTHINLENEPPFQGAIQVLVKWSKGMDPALYARRFR